MSKDRIIFKTIIDMINSNNSLDDRYDNICKLAGKVFGQIVDREDDIPCDINDEEELFQEYMYEWDILREKDIPFELWSDIAEDGLNLLVEMIEQNNLKYKENPKFRLLARKIAERIVELRKNPLYRERLYDFHRW